jgi:hypothetical protein
LDSQIILLSLEARRSKGIIKITIYIYIYLIKHVGSYVARVWGAEFQYTYGKVKVDDDVPCAACLTPKPKHQWRFLEKHYDNQMSNIFRLHKEGMAMSHKL